MLPLFTIPLEEGYELVTEPERVSHILQDLDRTPRVSLDLETTSLDFNRGIAHGVGLADAERAYYIAYGGEKYAMTHLNSFLKNKERVYGHNIAFDLHFLKKYNIDIPPSIIFDTMVAQHLIDENQYLGLKPLAESKLGYRNLKTFSQILATGRKATRKKASNVTIHDVPADVLGNYACTDVRANYDLGILTENELDREGMRDIFNETWMPLALLLGEMEENGFYIDQQALNELRRYLDAEIEKTLDEMYSIAPDVLPSSPQQVSNYLFNELGYTASSFTENGFAKVDDQVLKSLRGRDKSGYVDALINFRELSKMQSTYVEKFLDILFDGRLYGSFRIGPVTGRLLSSDPNLQNIPVRSEIGRRVRSAFVATPGYEMLVVDYSQLELRLLAHYSGAMMDVFWNNGDPHQATADLVGIARRDAKAVNFGWIYGVWVKGLADSIEKASGIRPSYSDCKEWLTGFDRAYPEAVKWKELVLKHGRRLGWVRTIGGRLRRLPDLNSRTEKFRSYAERQAVNSIIQGSAADIISWAMLIVAQQVKPYGARILSQVHDELVIETPIGTAKELKKEVQHTMESAQDHFNLRVPLVAEPGVGHSWVDAK